MGSLFSSRIPIELKNSFIVNKNNKDFYDFFNNVVLKQLDFSFNDTIFNPTGSFVNCQQNPFLFKTIFLDENIYPKSNDKNAHILKKERINMDDDNILTDDESTKAQYMYMKLLNYNNIFYIEDWFIKDKKHKNISIHDVQQINKSKLHNDYFCPIANATYIPTELKKKKRWHIVCMCQIDDLYDTTKTNNNILTHIKKYYFANNDNEYCCIIRIFFKKNKFKINAHYINLFVTNDQLFWIDFQKSINSSKRYVLYLPVNRHYF